MYAAEAAAMQADLRAALSTLQRVDASLLRDDEKNWRDQMRTRFDIAWWAPAEFATLGDTVVESYLRKAG